MCVDNTLPPGYMKVPSANAYEIVLVRPNLSRVSEKIDPMQSEAFCL